MPNKTLRCPVPVFMNRMSSSRQPFDGVGRGVDVDVLVLAGDGDHLLGPRIADVAAHDDQLGKVEGHLVDVGNRASGLRRPQRAGVTDLGAERHAGLDAFGEQRVVAAVGGRRVPQPGHHPQAHESFGDPAPQLADRLHRTVEVDRGQTGKPVRVQPDPFRDLVVGDQVLTARTAPRAEQAEVDVGGIHRRDGRLDRDVGVRDRPTGPAPQRGQHVAAQEPLRRMLHPHIDRHRAST